MTMLAPKVVFENSDFLVFFKPAGLNSDTDKLQNPSAEAWVHEYMGGHPSKRPFLIHRLDRTTSGLLLFAKRKVILQNFQENWKNVKKKYFAIIQGEIPVDSQTLIHYHRKDLREKRALISDFPRENYQKVVLHFRKIDTQKGYSLLGIQLETGKYHQIRAQFSHLGNPIVGDQYYGSTEAHHQPNSIYLHAGELEFFYRKTGEKFLFSCKPEGGLWDFFF